MKCMSSYCVTVCVSWRRKSTCRLFLGLQGFLWMEACCALTVGWMNGRERRTNEWERWRDVCGEIGRGGGYVILRFRSASRELVCLWLILSGWGGEGGWGWRGRERAREREREGQREEETEMKRMRKRKQERRGLVFFCPTFSFFLFHCSIPHQWCNTGDLFIAGRKPSSPLLLYPRSHFLSLSFSPPSLLAQLTDWMHEWTGLSLALLLTRWGEGWHRKLWGRPEQEKRKERVIRKRGRRESSHGVWYISTADLILYVRSRHYCLSSRTLCA